MAEPIASKVAEQGGAYFAVLSGVGGLLNHSFNWLNHNSSAVLALCAVGGLIVSGLGYRATKAHQQRMLELGVSQQQTLSNK